MTTRLRQLIPGNPGTSFVVALLYILQQKYSVLIKNADQVSIYAEGISKSRKVFFSGVLNKIAAKYDKQLVFLTNSESLLKSARSELVSNHVITEYSTLDYSAIRKLLTTHGFVAISIDLFYFRNYHDYHFVAVSKQGNTYIVFEPKEGICHKLSRGEFMKLIRSVYAGLADVSMALCI